MRISTVSAGGKRRKPVKSQRRGSSSACVPYYPLDAAAKQLDVRIMQRALVQMGPYKPEHARIYSVALHTVVAAGHEPLCRLLLVCRADLHAFPGHEPLCGLLRVCRAFVGDNDVAFAKQRLGGLLEAFVVVADQKGQESHVTSVVTSVAETLRSAVLAGDPQILHLIFGAASKFGTGSPNQDVDILSRAIGQGNACGQSLMHLWVTADAEAQDLQAVLKILSKHNVPGINARDRLGDSPLHLAIRQAVLQIREEDGPEKLKLARQLLEARAQPDLGDARMSETPLMEATCSGDAAACKLLLDFHADVNNTSSNGMSVLDCAAASPQVKQLFQTKIYQQGIMTKVFSAVRELDLGRLYMLLRRHGWFSDGSINILEPNSDGQTVLHLVSEMEVAPENEGLVQEIVGHLWSAAADLDCCNRLGETPLIVAARAAVKRRNPTQERARLAVTRLFLNLRANPNIPDSVGETALMEAASDGDFSLCSLLLTGRADVSQKSPAGRVAVDFLKRGERPKLFKLLGSPGSHATREEADPQNRKQQGDDQKTRSMVRDAKTLQAVRTAIEHGDVKALQSLLGSAEDPGRIVNKRDCDGCTVLFVAAARVPDSRTCETIGLLLDFQASIEAQNVLGERPLTLAVRSALDHWHCNNSWVASCGEAVVSLLKRRAMPDVATNLTGETPLMEASCRGGSALCQLLVAWSANPRLKSKAGLDAQDFADRHKHEALLKLNGYRATPPTKNAALPTKNQTPQPAPKTSSTDAADSDPSEAVECHLFKGSGVQQTDAPDSDSSEEGHLEELHGECAKEGLDMQRCTDPASLEVVLAQVKQWQEMSVEELHKECRDWGITTDVSLTTAELKRRLHKLLVECNRIGMPWMSAQSTLMASKYGSLVAQLMHHEFGQPRPTGEDGQLGTPILEQRQCGHLGFAPRRDDQQQVPDRQQEQDEVGYRCITPGCVRPSGHSPPCMDAQSEEIKVSVAYLCPTPGCVCPPDHCPPCMDAQCEEIKAIG